MLTLDNAHALVIGIANYEHVAPLPATILADARDVAALLIDPQHCGYNPDHVQALLDGGATGAAIRQALASMAQRGDRDSTVFIYISSHGGRIDAGPHAGAYLLPVDTVYTADHLADTAISGDEFTAALRALPARKVVVVFDCCHAGGIGQPKDATTPTLTPGLPERLYDALQSGQGRVILASSREDESSWALPGDANSLFTKHLLIGLRGGIASDDGLIRIFDLFEYLQPHVTADQPRQHPIFKAELEENFPVALYLGGLKGSAPTDEQGFRYDAYISYVDKEPDATWVWETLVPRMEGAGLRVAVSGDSGDPGVARVVNAERGIRQAKRTVVVLSEAYLSDGMADFEAVLGQTLGIQEGAYRLLPVAIAPIDDGRLPLRLSLLTRLDLTQPRRGAHELDRLIQALQGPLPRQWG